MRDQWRAEEDFRDSARRRERGTDYRRQISPAAPRRERDIGVGLKIKGRAEAESRPGSPSGRRRAKNEEDSTEHTKRDLSHSRRRPGDEQRPFHREANRDLRSERPHSREEVEPTRKRRRTRSRSPRSGVSDFREERRRPHSPIYSGRSDTFRPTSRSRSRRRERLPSPRGDHYSASYPETRFGDSYVPRPRRRASPPAYLDQYTSRKRSRSRDSYRHHKARKHHSPPRQRPASFDRLSRKDRDEAGPSDRPSTRQRKSSRGREAPHRRGRSPSRDPRGINRSSRSPLDKAERRGRTKMQQSPTRPIQSILDSGSNPGQATNPNAAFPMHGMNVHGTHQPSRPHLNTQQSYNTSPHYTPSSSHHASPQSGSPFSQGRGGWNGQPQQYQGGPRYKLSYLSSGFRLTLTLV